jgi:soluble lytic murein transglycosylase-like protein
MSICRKLIFLMLFITKYFYISARIKDIEHLSPEVRAGLYKSVINPFQPKLVFSNQKMANKWLDDMSLRLKKWVSDPILRKKYLTIIQYEATRADLDPQIVLSVITVEGKFNKYAIGSSGERGMMQVMPFWLNLIGNSNMDLFDVQTNIRFGCIILRYYLKLEKGNLTRALARYNGALLLPNYAGYPDKVMDAYYNYWIN